MAIFPIAGRHLPSHGGHLPDGKRSIRRELSAPCKTTTVLNKFQGFRQLEMAIPMQATGGVNSTPHRTRNIFARVAQD